MTLPQFERKNRVAFTTILSLSILCIIVFLTDACAGMGHAPKATSHHLPVPPESAVFVPVEVSVNTLKSALENSIKARPIAQGESPINGSLAVETTIKM